MLTEEQKEISLIDEEGVYVIRAVAGSGKTFTAIQYMKNHKDECILYLVFNKSNRKELTEKLKKEKIRNVEVHTIHSFIYGKTVTKKDSKFNSDHKKVVIGNGLSVDEDLCKLLSCDYDEADEIVKMYNGYMTSDKKALEYVEEEVRALFEKSVPLEEYIQIKVNYFLEKFKILNRAITKGELEISHDFYIKWYSNNGDVIRVYDTVIVDEAQDVSGAMLNILLKFRCSKLFLIGDSQQLIYEWRGAIDSLKEIRKYREVNFMQLSHSFRVGSKIAKLAEVLCGNPVVGRGNNTLIENIEDIMRYKVHTVMGVRNSELFKHYVDNIHRYKNEKIFYRNRDFRGLYNLIHFFNGNIGRVQDSILKKINGVKELLYIMNISEDVSFIFNEYNRNKLNEIKASWGNYLINNYSTYTRLILTYGLSFVSFALNNILKTSVKKEEDDFNVLFTTVHTSKGREYENLIILDDYNISMKLRGFSNREELVQLIETLRLDDTDGFLNVLYVSITRACGRVHFQNRLLSNLVKGIYKTE